LSCTPHHGAGMALLASLPRQGNPEIGFLSGTHTKTRPSSLPEQHMMSCTPRHGGG